jgi:hypothetical protein
MQICENDMIWKREWMAMMKNVNCMFLVLDVFEVREIYS